jgi:hypothetical protein
MLFIVINCFREKHVSVDYNTSPLWLITYECYECKEGLTTDTHKQWWKKL